MNKTHDDILDGKCTVLSVALLRRSASEVRIDILEQFPGGVEVLEE